VDPPSCPTHPSPTPGVDYITCKAAWDLIHESFNQLPSVGKKRVIERQVFRQHPKRMGDFSETLEVRIGKRLIKVDIEFVLEKGLRIRILEEGSSQVIQDAWFTQRSQYEEQLSTCLLV
jgi:hypothetical protein